MSNILDISFLLCYNKEKMSNIIDRSYYMINERMKEARAELGLSQAELARRVGVSRQTVNMIENGDYNPTVTLCIKICRVLERTLDELFWEDDTNGK